MNHYGMQSKIPWNKNWVAWLRCNLSAHSIYWLLAAASHVRESHERKIWEGIYEALASTCIDGSWTFFLSGIFRIYTGAWAAAARGTIFLSSKSINVNLEEREKMCSKPEYRPCFYYLFVKCYHARSSCVFSHWVSRTCNPCSFSEETQTIWYFYKLRCCNSTSSRLFFKIGRTWETILRQILQKLVNSGLLNNSSGNAYFNFGTLFPSNQAYYNWNYYQF